MVEFEPNSLGVVSVNIMKTSEFFMAFQGASVIIWTSSSPTLYSIDKFTNYKFVSDNKKNEGSDIFVLFGSNDDIKVGIPASSGFGIKLKNNLNHYWIDKFNENELVVINYNSEWKKMD